MHFVASHQNLTELCAVQLKEQPDPREQATLHDSLQLERGESSKLRQGTGGAAGQAEGGNCRGRAGKAQQSLEELLTSKQSMVARREVFPHHLRLAGGEHNKYKYLHCSQVFLLPFSPVAAQGQLTPVLTYSQQGKQLSLFGSVHNLHTSEARALQNTPWEAATWSTSQGPT